jgi:hypothetical protein
MAKSKTVDANIVVLAFSEPYATLVDNLAIYNFGIVPKSFDPKRPAATPPSSSNPSPRGRDQVRTERDVVRGGPSLLDAIVMTTSETRRVRRTAFSRSNWT